MLVFDWVVVVASGFSTVSPALAEIDALSELTVVAGVEVVRGRVLIVCLVLGGSTTVEGFVCLVSGEIAVVVSCPEFTVVEVVEVLTAGVEVCKVVVLMVFPLTLAFSAMLVVDCVVVVASGFSRISPATAEIVAFSELTVVAGVEAVSGPVLVV